MQTKMNLVWRVVVALVLVISLGLTTAIPVGAADLTVVSATPTDSDAGATTTYTISFTTATTGTIATIDTVFPAGFDVSAAVLDSATGIGAGTLGVSGQTLTYTVTEPAEIANSITITLTFSNIANAQTAGDAYTVTVTTFDSVPAAIDTATSAAFAIVPADLDSYIVVPADIAQTAGTAFNVTITAVDEFGNVITDEDATLNGYTFNFSGPGNAPFAGNIIYPATTNFISGVWTDSVTLVKAETVALTVSDGTHQGVSEDITVGASDAANITMSVDDDSITAGNIATFTVSTVDAYGNLISDVTGDATFSIDATAGGSWSNNVYTSAKAGEWEAESHYATYIALASLTVAAADANTLSITSQPSAMSMAGAAIGPVNVTVVDTYGNPVAGVEVTVSEVGGYTFNAGTLTQTTDANGIASFDDLVINTIGTDYQLEFTSAGLLPVQSDTFTVYEIRNTNSGETYATIQDAINEASSGDTITVSAGTYAENLSINQSITLSGSGPTTTCITYYSADANIYIGDYNVTIQGFEIANGYDGINIDTISADNEITIDNTVIHACDGYGVYVGTVNGTLNILNSILSDNDYQCIYIETVDQPDLEALVIADPADAGGSVLIENNHIGEYTDTDWNFSADGDYATWNDGIYIDDIYHNSSVVIRNNTINATDCEGIDVEYIYYGSTLTIEGNTFNENSCEGIYIDELYYNSTLNIDGNTIDNNDCEGIEIYYIDYGSTLNVTNNISTNNDDAGVFIEYLGWDEPWQDEEASAEVYYNSFKEYGTNYVTIEGNTFTGNYDYGIEMEYADFAAIITIQNNIISDNPEGIELEYFGQNGEDFYLNPDTADVQLDTVNYPEYFGPLVLIKGNTITNNEYGIYQEDAWEYDTNVTIENNIITGNSYFGIGTEWYDICNDAHVIVRGNTITSNGADGQDGGISLYYDYGYDSNGIYYASSYTIENNLISDNIGYGIHIDEVYDASQVTIAGNDIQDNDGYGIYVESLYNDSSSINVHYNNITNTNEDADAFGAYNYGDGSTDYGVVDATNNWWGSASGPYQATTNPDGTGLEVSDYVLYEPWLNEPYNHQVVVTLTASSKTSNPGQAVTFTAAVSSTTGTPTGLVTFKDGSNELATVDLVSGQAAYTTSDLSAGSHTMAAVYNGGAVYPVTTVTLSHRVGSSGGTVPPISGKAITLSGFTSPCDILVNSSGVTQATYIMHSPDGKLTIDLAPGTKLTQSTGSAISSLSLQTLSPLPAAPSGSALLLGYSFGPAGATFNPALTLTLKYDPAALPAGVAEEDLYIAYFDGTNWLSLESFVNTQAKTVTAYITHFSSYAVLGKITPQETTPVVTQTPTPTAPSTTTEPVKTTTPATTVSPTPAKTTTPAQTSTPAVTQTTSPAATTEPTAPNNLPLILGIIGAIVVVVLVIFVIMRRKSQK